MLPPLQSLHLQQRAPANAYGPLQYLCKSCDQTSPDGRASRSAMPARRRYPGRSGRSVSVLRCGAGSDGTGRNDGACQADIQVDCALFAALWMNIQGGCSRARATSGTATRYISRFARRRGGFLPSWTAPAGSYCPMTCLLQNSTADPPPVCSRKESCRNRPVGAGNRRPAGVSVQPIRAFWRRQRLQADPRPGDSPEEPLQS